MKILAVVSFILILVFFPLLIVFSRNSDFNYYWFLIIGLIITIIAFIYLLIYFIIVIPKKKKKKIEAEEKRTKEDRIEKISEKIKTINEMPFKDWLEQNDFKQYCEIFEQNKIENLNTGLKLTDTDLLNVGISVLGDRIKILSLLEEKRAALKRGTELLNRLIRGEEKRINKHIYTWVGSFLFGYFGVDRFMRGQTGYGISKLLLDWFGIWAIIDFIIALSMYGKYKEEFIFINGDWE